MNRKSKMQEGQIIALYTAGENISDIAEKLGIHRDTVSGYVKAHGFAVKRGRPGKTGNLDLRVPTGFDSKPTILESGCPPGLAPPKTSSLPPSQSQCETHREFITERLARGMDAYYIWYDLKTEFGFQVGYDSVKRFVRKLKAKAPEVFAVIPTFPGREAQVDYGRGALTRHPITGKYQRPWLFCLKLSHSRKCFRKVMWKSSSLAWAQAHEEAFRFFGGVPATVLLDNLKEGVIKPDFYEPELNPLYAKMLDHYGCVALPCRVRTPRHKGKVENEIKYTQGALKGRTFETIDEQQKFLDHFGKHCADTRIHGTIKRQVNEVFLTEEKSALKALPEDRFTLSQVLSRKVHPDGHVVVDSAYYSVPHTHVGSEVTACVDHLFVTIIDPKTQNTLARHTIAKPGRFTTNQDHLPKQKQLTSLHASLLERAATVGGSTHELAQKILNTDPYRSIRSVQGILSLTRTFATKDIEQAATLCLEKGLHRYRALKNLLEHQKTSPTQVVGSLMQNHECIRLASEYGLLFNEFTKSTGENPCL